MSKLTVVYHDIHKLYCSLRANQHARNFKPHPGIFQGRGQFLPWTRENDPSGEDPAVESDSNSPLMTLASAISAHVFPHHQADIGKTHVIKTCCQIKGKTKSFRTLGPANFQTWFVCNDHGWHVVHVTVHVNMCEQLYLKHPKQL